MAYMACRGLLPVYYGCYRSQWLLHRAWVSFLLDVHLDVILPTHILDSLFDTDDMAMDTISIGKTSCNDK